MLKFFGGISSCINDMYFWGGKMYFSRYGSGCHLALCYHIFLG